MTKDDVSGIVGIVYIILIIWAMVSFFKWASTSVKEEERRQEEALAQKMYCIENNGTWVEYKGTDGGCVYKK